LFPGDNASAHQTTRAGFIRCQLGFDGSCCGYSCEPPEESVLKIPARLRRMADFQKTIGDGLALRLMA
jgi:hypothetical protein